MEGVVLYLQGLYIDDITVETAMPKEFVNQSLENAFDKHTLSRTEL